MKKLVLLSAFVAFLCADVLAQENQIIVRGKTFDKKNVKVEYYKGKTEDIITNIEYDLIDELQAKVKKYENEIAQLKKEKNGNNSTETKILNKRINDLEDSLSYYVNKSNELARIFNNTRNNTSLVIDSLTNANRQLRFDVKKYSADIEKTRLNESYKKSTYTSIALDFGLGINLLNNNNMKEQIWSKGLYSTKYIDLTVETFRLTHGFPLSLSVGVQYRNMTIGGIMQDFTENANTKDVDGDNCTIIRSYMGISEKVSLSYIGVPVSLNFGQPSAAKVSGYGKISFIPAYNVSRKLTSSGTYTAVGYYENWDVTLADIPELGYVTDAPAYSNDIDPEINKFALFGSVSGGVYVPCCNIKKNPKGASLVFKAGVKLDYTLLSVSNACHDDVFKYHVNSYNTLEMTKVFTTSFEIGFVYLFR